ncbi:MAG: copper resistance protein CopC [Gemmatimonadota bacterium]
MRTVSSHFGGRRSSWAALLTLLLLVPAQALAHTALRSSSPANGAHLGEVPRELRLRFNEPVELALARIALVGPEGAEATLGELQNAPDSATVVVAPIEGPLSAGTYTVRWQIAGADGHPVRGEYTFMISPGARGLAAGPGPAAPGQAAPPAGHHHDPTSFPTGEGFDANSPLYVAVRWLTFVGLLGVVGAVAFRLLVLPLAGRRPLSTAPMLYDSASRRAAHVGLWMAVVVAVAAALRLFAQSYALHGAGGAWNPGLLAALLSRTTWGWGWLLQAGGVVPALAGFAGAARGARAGWVTAAAGALALSFTPGLSGHAAASQELAPVAILADGLHVLGAGGWLGSLLLVMVAGVPAAMRLGHAARGKAVADLVNGFSPTALLFAGIVVATGVFAAWLHLGSVADLWERGYGRTLLLKLGVLSVVFGTGAYNWLKVRPALGSEEAAGRLRRSAALELAVGVLVLGITAALVATSPAVEMDVTEQSGGDSVAAAEPHP